MSSPLRRLLPYHARYWAPFWGSALLLLSARGLEALTPLLLRTSIDGIAAAQPQIVDGRMAWETARSALLWPSIAILVIAALRFLMLAQARRVIRRIAVYVAYDLRKRVYAHLQLQGPSFFARYPTGDLMARAINDIGLVRELIGSGFRTLLVNVVMASLGIIAMLLLAPSLSVLLLLPLVPIGVTGWFASRAVFRRSLQVQEGFSQLSDQVQGNLAGIRTVQALVQEANEIRRFDRVNADYLERFLRLVRLNSLIAAVMPWFAAVSTIIILGYGGHLVQQGELSVGTLTAFFSYAGMTFWPIREIGAMVTQWQRGASGTQRLFEILDSPPEIRDGDGAGVPERIVGLIEFRGLSYRYVGAMRAALTNVSMKLEVGASLAILGRVGAGKTTLLNCCVRLLDPPPGTLLIDGHDVRNFSLDQLRRDIALVPQDPFLFAEMLRHNLSYDDPTRDEPEIWRAVDDADLLSTVKSFEDELDTLVGERGVTLSGGQKQRSTLARGLIRDAPVLILDDCFSAVDTQTEERILSRLFSTRRGRTTILVTNRVSTARHAEKILVLEAGSVAEMGTHTELLAAGGRYADLERMQRLDPLESSAAVEAAS